MDSIVTAAARALAQGDPLGALKRVALRDDAPSLALRGVAMAQLGDFARARVLIRRAQRAFGPREALARARCVVIDAEIALAARELSVRPRAIEAARVALEKHGDHVNAARAGYLEVRRLVLTGQLGLAQSELDRFDPARMPLATRVLHQLLRADIAIRVLDIAQARSALLLAREAAVRAAIPALSAEVESLANLLNAPAAREISGGSERLLSLAQVAAVISGPGLIVDACRHIVRRAGGVVALNKRPVLFALVRLLAEAWPLDVSRERLVAQVFRARHIDESHRVRLRVELGRLRLAIGTMADIRATKAGYQLIPQDANPVVVLAQPMEGEFAALLALLADGESWSSSALALASGASQRSVQRALEALGKEGRVQSIGRGRARRWLTPPIPGFATTLLLPAPLPSD